MVNKCNVVNCRGNYNSENKCRVFKLPRDEEGQTWINRIPPCKNFTIDPSKFFICENHWNHGYPTVKIPGGSTRPSIPPSVFNVPKSCLPTYKAPPRPKKVQDRQLKFFRKKDNIGSLKNFNPDKKTLKNL